MKYLTQVLQTTAFAALSAIMVLPSAAFAGGFDSGNAGDAYSAEFIFTGRDILQRLEIAAKDGAPIYPTAKLRKAIEDTHVASADHTTVNGNETDARNEPSNHLITVNRTRWATYRTPAETFARLRLALHEYLWLTGVPDDKYAVSEPIVRKLNIPDYSPSVWLNSPGTPFPVAECTGRATDGTFVTVTVNTKGATNAPDSAEVSIERGGNKFGYRFAATEISQFFEYDDVKANTAIVGMGAFVKREFPLSLKYAGPNYVDMDLKAVLDDATAGGQGNFMRVWKGPGYQAVDQYVLTQPVCSVGSNN